MKPSMAVRKEARRLFEARRKQERKARLKDIKRATFAPPSVPVTLPARQQRPAPTFALARGPSNTEARKRGRPPYRQKDGKSPLDVMRQARANEKRERRARR